MKKFLMLFVICVLLFAGNAKAEHGDVHDPRPTSSRTHHSVHWTAFVIDLLLHMRIVGG